jgi:hypothetical protein
VKIQFRRQELNGRIGTDELLVQRSRILCETLSHNTESSTGARKGNLKTSETVVMKKGGVRSHRVTNNKAYLSHKHRQIARPFKFGDRHMYNPGTLQ